MKPLITILMLIVVSGFGLFSLHFFRANDYDLNWLFNLAAYGSLVAGIYIMTSRHTGNRRKRFGH